MGRVGHVPDLLLQPRAPLGSTSPHAPIPVPRKALPPTTPTPSRPLSECVGGEAVRARGRQAGASQCEQGRA